MNPKIFLKKTSSCKASRLPSAASFVYSRNAEFFGKLALIPCLMLGMFTGRLKAPACYINKGTSTRSHDVFVAQVFSK